MKSRKGDLLDLRDTAEFTDNSYDEGLLKHRISFAENDILYIYISHETPATHLYVSQHLSVTGIRLSRRVPRQS